MASICCFGLIGDPLLRLWKRLRRDAAAAAPGPPSTTCSGWMETPRLCVKDVDVGSGCCWRVELRVCQMRTIPLPKT